MASDVQHNGRKFGLTGYRDMLINDFEQIPDLFFKIGILTCETPFVAARLEFDCSPKGAFLGLPVNGRRISFAENVFYQFRDRRIAAVWSSIDKAAIEAQLNLLSRNGPALAVGKRYSHTRVIPTPIWRVETPPDVRFPS